MANYTMNKTVHATLAAGVVDVVTMGSDYDEVEVYNLSANRIYILVNSTANPTVAGADTEVIPPNTSRHMLAPGRNTTIRLISAASSDYAVAAR